MLSFDEFLKKTNLPKNLNSEFEILRNFELETIVNNYYGKRICKGRMAVFQSEHMKNKGLSVIRFMNYDGEMEYHIHSDNTNEECFPEQDEVSFLQALKIIHDDAIFHLNIEKPIRLQSDTEFQTEIYKILSDHLIQNKFNWKITNQGKMPILDGFSRDSIIMEYDLEKNGKYILWRDFKRAIEEEKNNEIKSQLLKMEKLNVSNV